MVIRFVVSFCLCLVAAPSVAQLALAQSTYLGYVGPWNQGCIESMHQLAAADGEVYVLGNTSCDDLPGTAGGAFPERAGEYDAFVMRLRADLGAVLGATYYGGPSLDYALDLVVTADSVYITGYTCSAGLPGTSLGSQAAIAGASDAFVAQFDRGLTQLTQSTFLGGGGADVGLGIAVDGDGVYVSGSTSSTDFPGAATGPQPAYGGGLGDGFLARLPVSLRGPIRSTYLGGAGVDRAGALAIDGDSIFVTGYAGEPPLPGDIWQENRDQDAFVARLDRDLSQFLGSSFLGGSSYEYATDIAVAGGWVYIVGDTYSPDLPFTADAAQPSSGEVSPDVFVARFPRSLSGRVQTTYLGEASFSRRIWVGVGAVVVSGTVHSGEAHHSGAGDQVFIAVFEEDLRTLRQAIAFGGSGDEWGMAMAVELDGGGRVTSVFLAGRTTSADLPAVEGGLQQVRQGSINAFVARFTGGETIGGIIE